MDSNQFQRALDNEENCKHISAAELRISLGDNLSHWEMVSDRSSIMFPKKICRLKSVCQFDVKGEIACSLPPGRYTVSWRAYLPADSVGWDCEPVHFTFSKNETEIISECKCYMNRTRSGTSGLPTIRVVENDWTEYEIAEFVVEEGKENCALKFAMLATAGFCKSGLSLDGIFIRPMGFRVPIKLIDVDLSLASYHGDTLEIHTQSFSRIVENYCIISYVWSQVDDNFAVDEIIRGTLTRRRRTIRSCSLASFVAMLDICDQMGMKHVWIDCICVEQDVTEVKSLQLAEMGYYYSCAKRCLVFLEGLNMYIPPIYEGGNTGSWYDRVWVVQESAYTFRKKTFVHALPPALAVLEASDTITFLKCRSEHTDLISRVLTHNKIHGRPENELCKVEDVPHVSKWLLGLVSEENYPALLKLLPQLASEVKFCWTHWISGTTLRDKTIRSLDLKPSNVSQIIREALRGSRGCKFPQDRVYSIMTLLGIGLDVSYSRSLKDTICKAAETMSPEMLVRFVTATWYSQDGHALPEVSNDHIGAASLVVMGIFNCINDIKVEGSGLLITTKTRSVSISRLGDTFYSSQRVVLGMYYTHGHAFLVNGDVKARGEVDLGTPSRGVRSDLMEVKLLFMGKSLMKGFQIGNGGLMTGSGDEVPANVCLVVCSVNALWKKVGVLYVSEEVIFEQETEKLTLYL